MTTLKNFVAIDWRNGPDRIYFFFKDTNTYSRFNFGDNSVADGHPTTVDDHWDDFDKHVKDLRFGFNTSGINWHHTNDGDIAWFFYYDGNTKMVCKYKQSEDKVLFKKPISETDWWPLGNYFDRIVGVMWDEKAETKHTFWVLLNDGRYFTYSPWLGKLPKPKPLANSVWSDLEPYTDRMITAALNDHPAFNTFFYIFLTDNEYMRFDFKERKVLGPIQVDEDSWPGLIAE